MPPLPARRRRTGGGGTARDTGGAADAPGDAARDRAAVPAGAGAGARSDRRRAASPRVPLAGERALPDADAAGAGARSDRRRAASPRVPLAGERALPDADAAGGRVGHGERHGSRRAGGRPTVPARAALGFLYFRGLGVPQDDAERIRWTRRAAEQGNARAQNQAASSTPISTRGRWRLNGELLGSSTGTAYRSRALASPFPRRSPPYLRSQIDHRLQLPRSGCLGEGMGRVGL